MFNILPSFYIIAGAIVMLMLVAAFYRNHKIVAAISFTGMALAFSFLFVDSGQKIPAWANYLLTFDKLTLLITGISLIAAMLLNVFSYFYLARQNEQKEEYYVLLNTALLGTMVMIGANHFITFFMGLELLSIPLYVMVAYLREKPAATEAGIKYLTLAGASTAAMLFGFALIYFGTGSMSLTLLNEYFNTLKVFPAYVFAGLALFIVSIGFKFALAPFHMWVADVYTGSPSPVTAFLASVAKVGALVFVLRFFSGTGINNIYSVYVALGVIAALSMFTGNLLALWQNNIKRILAYSSIAHMGYLLILIISGSEAGFNSAIFYLVSYMVASIAAFALIASLSAEENNRSIDWLRGLYFRQPFAAIVLAAAVLSLAGMPLTSGFIAKILVIVTGAGTNNWWLVWLLIINSAIGLFYYLRIVGIMFKKQSTDQTDKVALPLLVALSLAFLLLVIVWLGVAPGGFMGLLK